MVKVNVSNNGERVTIMTDDGKEICVDYREFVNVFKDYTKALSEYSFHLLYFLKKFNVDEESIEAVMKEVRARLTKKCPHCHGRLVKAGFKVTRSGKRQRFQCIECGRYVF
jgi:transposase-like protein